MHMYDKYDIYVGINIFKQPVFKSESLGRWHKSFLFYLPTEICFTGRISRRIAICKVPLQNKNSKHRGEFLVVKIIYLFSVIALFFMAV